MEKIFTKVLFCATVFMWTTGYMANYIITESQYRLLTEASPSAEAEDFIRAYGRHSRHITPAAAQKLIEVAGRLGVKPNHLAALIMNESGFNPNAYNRGGDAVGLIQFTPVARRQLGVTKEQIQAMDTVAQLELVYQYFKPLASRIHSVADFAIAGAAPAYLGKPDNTPIYRRGDGVYEANKYWDLDNDGVVTVGEIKRKFISTLRPEVRAFMNVSGSSSPRIEVPQLPNQYTRVDNTRTVPPRVNDFGNVMGSIADLARIDTNAGGHRL